MALSDPISVSSSNVSTVAYDPIDGTLRVEFKNGGTYDYLRVPEATFRNLINARSPGTYLHDHIKGTFHYEQVR